MKQKITIGLLATFALTGFAFSTQASALDTLTNEQEAIRATAYAFYDRGAAFQYDNSTLTYKGRGKLDFGPPAAFTPGGATRGLYFYNPEIATESDRQYTVCSSFVYQVFHDAFSKNQAGYKINYPLIGIGDEVSYDTTALFMTEIGNPHTTFYSANRNNETIFSEDLTVFYIDKDTYYKKDNDNNVTLCDQDNPTGCPSYFEFGADPTKKNGAYDSAKVAALKADLDSIIQPGDVVSYYLDNDAGHTVVYLGNNEVLESRSANPDGSVYNFSSLKDFLETDGAISLLPKDAPSGTKSLWSSSRALQTRAIKITILRPLNEIKKNNYTVSANANARTNYFRLVPTKTASVGRYGSVDLGGSITYTISIANKSDTNYSDITVEDKLPDGVVLESVDDNACSISGQSLKCQNLSVNAGEAIGINYTVKVPENFNRRYFETPNTTINGIPLTNIVTYVGDTIDSTDMAMFNSVVESRASDTFDDSMDYITSIYENLGITLDDSATILGKILKDDGVVSENERGNIIRSILNRLNSIGSSFMVRKVNPSDDYYSNMYMHGRFGGTMVVSDRGVEEERRMRYLESTDFTVGDVIIIDDGNAMKDALIYIGNGKFNHVKDGAVETLETNRAVTLLQSLIGRESFVILRPTLALTKYVEPESDENDDVIPSVPDTGSVENPNTAVDYSICFFAILAVGSAIALRKHTRR